MIGVLLVAVAAYWFIRPRSVVQTVSIQTAEMSTAQATPLPNTPSPRLALQQVAQGNRVTPGDSVLREENERRASEQLRFERAREEAGERDLRRQQEQEALRQAELARNPAKCAEGSERQV